MPIVHVRASEGTARVSVEYPFGGRKVFVALEPHVLRRDGRSVTVPAGVIYLHHNDLERRTKGKVKHALVEQGLYHLLRLAEHVQIGTSLETSEMIERRAEIRGAAAFLLQSGYATKEEHDGVIDALRELQRSFVRPKRRPEKLAAGERLGKAQALREAVDRRKIAPSSLTAYAAGKQVTKRITSLPRIGGYFSGCAIRVVAVIRDAENRIDRLWKFFGNGVPVSVIRFDDVIEGMWSLSGSDLEKVIRKAGLRRYADEMRTIVCRPFYPLASATATHLDALADAVLRHEDDRVMAIAQEIRGMLRQMRMIPYVERMLVGRLSLYLDRSPHRPWPNDDPRLKEVRTRFENTAERIHALGSDDLDDGILDEAVMLFDEASTFLKSGDLEFAKVRLKDMTAALAAVPPLSDPGEDAARAS